MPNDTRDLDTEEMHAWRALLRAHASVISAVDRELTAAHKMPLADFDVLQQLCESPDNSLRMTELAKNVLLSPSGLTRRLDGLVKAGLVERAPCPSDGRGLLAVLTAAGKDAVQRIAPTHHQALRAHFVDCLSRPQLQELVNIIEPIATRNESGDSCAPTVVSDSGEEDRSADISNHSRERVSA